MTRFLAERDLSQLPRRLASQLSKARKLLDDRKRMRAQVTNTKTSLSAVTEYYGSCLAPLVQATAALTELVDDGELLRLITSLVALMKVKEANAAEHAVVVHALAAGEFAPGAYREFVTLTTASQSYLDVFRTLANQSGLLDPESLSGEAAQAVAIRDRVSNWLDGPPPASAEAWFLAQASKLRHMRGVEAELNDRVRDEALLRIADTRQELALGVGLAALVLVISSVYLDAKPAEAWRTLIEVRFTNAPHGLVENYGGLAGAFKRVDTRQFDPHGSGFNVPMWRGSIVLERAWTEWQPFQFLNVRVGNFFTPWGIWNIDHGSPTLITLQLPQMIL